MASVLMGTGPSPRLDTLNKEGREVYGGSCLRYRLLAVLIAMKKQVRGLSDP